MKLGIEGKRALVTGSSKGLGFACALSLAREGVELTICARTQETLEKAALAIKHECGRQPSFVTADIVTEEGRARLFEACPSPDILVTNVGGPQPGDFRNWTRDDWIRALDASMLTPIALIKAALDGMIERRFGRIVNITSAAVKAPIDVLGLGNGARSGLTGFVGGLSRQTASHNVTINNILPGPFATERLETTMSAMAKANGITLEEAKSRRMAANPAKRFGDPSELGELCAYLCSSQAGFITGQNIVIDGGAFPGAL
jgi:3-oxoacyl-[acyl-carrier protein] reductase